MKGRWTLKLYPPSLLPEREAVKIDRGVKEELFLGTQEPSRMCEGIRAYCCKVSRELSQLKWQFPLCGRNK